MASKSQQAVFTCHVRIKKRGNHPFDTHRIYGQVYKSVPPTSMDLVVVDGHLYTLDDEKLKVPDITGFDVVDEIPQLGESGL